MSVTSLAPSALASFACAAVRRRTPGARSLKNFSQRCTACQLCVSQCPEKVLRPSTKLTSLMQPEMNYSDGY